MNITTNMKEVFSMTQLKLWAWLRHKYTIVIFSY